MLAGCLNQGIREISYFFTIVYFAFNSKKAHTLTCAQVRRGREGELPIINSLRYAKADYNYQRSSAKLKYKIGDRHNPDRRFQIFSRSKYSIIEGTM
jgi:hypothetical protein